jgi:hypothetical protein
MPHFGLMDPEGMKPEDASLLRARLHIRGGKRRISEGKIASGVAALHDALIHGIEWFLVSRHPELISSSSGIEYDLTDDDTLIQLLHKTQAFSDTFYLDEFKYIGEILDHALYREMNGFDDKKYLASIHVFMEKIGVEPFSEEDLPSEDPTTY